MKKFLTVVFCKFYEWIKVDYKAMYLASLLISFNVITVMGYYKCFVEHTSHFLFPRSIEILVAILVALILNVLFLKGKKYVGIYEDFKKSKYSGRLGTQITVAYIVFTVLFFASLIPIARMYKL